MSRERMIGSKLNQKNSLVNPWAYLNCRLVRASTRKDSRNLSFWTYNAHFFCSIFLIFFWLICLSKIKSGFSFANQGTIKARLVSRSCDPKTKSIVGKRVICFPSSLFNTREQHRLCLVAQIQVWIKYCWRVQWRRKWSRLTSKMAMCVQLIEGLDFPSKTTTRPCRLLSQI